MKNWIGLDEKVKEGLKNAVSGKPFGKKFVDAENFHDYFLYTSYTNYMIGRVLLHIFDSEGKEIHTDWENMPSSLLTTKTDFNKVKKKSKELMKKARNWLYHEGRIPSEK